MTRTAVVALLLFSVLVACRRHDERLPAGLSAQELQAKAEADRERRSALKRTPPRFKGNSL